MRNYINMICFLLLLSIISAIILTAFNVQTKDLIDLNRQQERILHILKAMRVMSPEVEQALKQDRELQNMAVSTEIEQFQHEAKLLERLQHHLKQQTPEHLSKLFADNITVLEINPRENYAVVLYTGKEFVELPSQAIDYMHNLYIFKMHRPDGDLYTFEIAGAGFWDKVSGYLTLRSGLRKISGITFFDHKETPGLGQRIEEGWFQAQFTIWQKEVLKPNTNKIALHVTRRNGLYDGDSQKKSINEVDAITGASETSRALDKFIPENLDRTFRILGKVLGNESVQKFLDPDTLEILKQYSL